MKEELADAQSHLDQALRALGKHVSGSELEVAMALI